MGDAAAVRVVHGICERGHELGRVLKRDRLNSGFEPLGRFSYGRIPLWHWGRLRGVGIGGTTHSPAIPLGKRVCVFATI
jgi:hypothetical protein